MSFDLCKSTVVDKASAADSHVDVKYASIKAITTGGETILFFIVFDFLEIEAYVVRIV